MQTVQIPEPSDFPDAAGVNEKINAVETTLSGLQSRLANLPDHANISERISDLETGISECHDALEQVRDRLSKLTPPDLTAINQEIATLKAKLSALENLSPPNTSGPQQTPTNPPQQTQQTPAADIPTPLAGDPTTPISPSPGAIETMAAANPAQKKENADARPVQKAGRPGHRLI